MPLRILLDVHIAPKLADQLVAKGIDAVAVSMWHEGKFREADDETILRAAHAERRSLATYDVSSIPRLLREFATGDVDHSGVIFISSKTIPQSKIGDLVRSLNYLAARYQQSDLHNKVTWAPKD